MVLQGPMTNSHHFDQSIKAEFHYCVFYVPVLTERFKSKGGDYMESFQPGLSFSLCDEAGIILRLVYMARSVRAELNIQVYTSQDEISAGRKQ